MPGQPGNAAIAGPRTTYGAPFNRIDELVPGDKIEAYTLQGKFTYEVVAPPEGEGIQRGLGWWTVLPSQGEVIGPLHDGHNSLTLTACHPKYSAAQRIIVRARMITESVAPAPAPPPKRPAEPKPSHDEAMDEALSGEGHALVPALGFGAGALVVLALAWWLGKRFGHRVVAYAVATPAICVLMWFCFVWTDRWLPAI
jgi:sortase A